MILAATVDLPTILPLKASLESGLLERSDHYLNYECKSGKRFPRLSCSHQKQQIIERIYQIIKRGPRIMVKNPGFDQDVKVLRFHL